MTSPISSAKTNGAAVKIQELRLRQAYQANDFTSWLREGSVIGSSDWIF